MTSSDGGRGDFLAGLIIGGLVGILTGILMAPAAGPEVRQQLRETAWETSDRVRSSVTSIAARVKEGASGVVEEVRARVPGSRRASFAEEETETVSAE